MYCNYCRASNPDDSSYCARCGRALVPTAPAPDALDSAATEIGLLPGTRLLDRYRIARELGAGGMGMVYLAHDEKLDMPVAIKVLRDVLSRDPGSVKRLIAEAKHSMILAHANIVRVHNFEDGPTTKFLVMEYVEGETLAHRIAREGKLGEEETRRIAVEICKGLEHAHERSVIHRDLKPGNILLGKDGSVKIADFGIARVCRDSMSRLTSQVSSGTLLYMSPEQLAGKSNEASDVYSLGVLLYEMLSGEPPFQSGDIPYQIREMSPEPLPGVSAAMNATVLRCLAKKPEKRFASVRELRAELEGRPPAAAVEEERPVRLEEGRPPVEVRQAEESIAEKPREAVVPEPERATWPEHICSPPEAAPPVEPMPPVRPVRKRRFLKIALAAAAAVVLIVVAAVLWDEYGPYYPSGGSISIDDSSRSAGGIIVDDGSRAAGGGDKSSYREPETRPAPPAGMQVWNDPEGNVSVPYPYTWQSDGQAIARIRTVAPWYAFAAADAATRASVEVYVLYGIGTVQEVVGHMQGAATALGINLQLGQPQQAALGSRAAVGVPFNMAGPLGMVTGWVYIAHNARGSVCVAVSAPPPLYNTMLPTFQQILTATRVGY